MLVNALTFDVEDYYHVQAFAGVIRPSNWDSYPSRVEKNTYRVLQILNSRGIRATFFVLGWVAERCRALVKEIFRAGHEIGSHGYNHEMIRPGGVTAFRNDILRGKSLLEDQIGIAVKIYRAPSYSITSETLWALEILAETGFESDSSIFPIFHDNYGIPDAPRFPYYISLKNGGNIVEFPPSTLRICGANFPVAGGGYFRLYPYSATARAIRHINDTERRPALVYLHPWEIDPDQPRIAAGWRSRLRHYHHLHSTEPKLLRLLDDFSWAPMSDVLANALHKEYGNTEVADGV